MLVQGMNEKNSQPLTMVIRPRTRVGACQIDVLYLDVDNCEELVHPLPFPGPAPWFKTLFPQIRLVFDSGITSVAIDLREVSYVNSASLGDMVDLRKEIESNSGKLVLVNLCPRVQTIFEVTQLNRIFMILDTLEHGARFLRTGQMPQI
jgi:anti-anti-sigma factor